MIRHTVLMKFTDKGNAAETKTRLEALAPQIPQIDSLDVGLDVVGSAVSYDLVLTTTHADLDALRGYQSHPVHEEFGGWLRPLLADRAVVDAEF